MLSFVIAYFKVPVKMFCAVPFKPARGAVFHSGFSQIEMLTAIAIMPILLVAAIPVLPKTSSNARQAAREIIKEHLQQTRAHVIANDTRMKELFSSLGARSETDPQPTAIFELELRVCSFRRLVGTAPTTLAARGQLDHSLCDSPSII